MSSEQPSACVDYQAIVNRLYAKFDYDFVGIAMRESQSPHQIRWTYVAGNTNQRYRWIVLRNGIGIAGYVLQTGIPFLNNATLDLDYRDRMYCPIARAEKLTNVVAIPLTTPPFQLVNGVLLVGFRHQGHKVSHRDVQRLSQSLL